MRAIRRHHAARLKARFKRIIKDQWRILGPTLSEEKIAAMAARKAAHHCCDCFVCRKPRYERTTWAWEDA